jgi:hypothetical protein
LPPKTSKLFGFWLSNILTMSISDESNSRNTSGALTQRHIDLTPMPWRDTMFHPVDTTPFLNLQSTPCNENSVEFESYVERSQYKSDDR